MKRVIRAAIADSEFEKEIAIKQRILDAVNKLQEPAKFKTSKVSLKGAKHNDQIAVGITNDHRGYTATIELGDGARYEATASTFDEAKEEFGKLADKYIRYSFRFRGRKLTDEEYADLTNGL